MTCLSVPCDCKYIIGIYLSRPEALAASCLSSTPGVSPVVVWTTRFRYIEDENRDVIRRATKRRIHLTSVELSVKGQIPKSFDLDVTPKIKWNIDLEGTKVQDISALRHCVGLQALILCDTQVQVISALRHCVGLQYLDLDGAKVQDISALRHCARLRGISLRDNQIHTSLILINYNT